MKIKRFNEKYEVDTDYSSGISEEYAKLIVSEYLDRVDKDDNKIVTLQDVFNEIIKGDELEEDQEILIIEDLKDLGVDIAKQASKLKTSEEYHASKYNL